MYVKAFTFGGIFIWLVWMASATLHHVGAMASYEPSGSDLLSIACPRLDANITRLSGGAEGAEDRACNQSGLRLDALMSAHPGWRFSVSTKLLSLRRCAKVSDRYSNHMTRRATQAPKPSK